MNREDVRAWLLLQLLQALPWVLSLGSLFRKHREIFVASSLLSSPTSGDPGPQLMEMSQPLAAWPHETCCGARCHYFLPQGKGWDRARACPSRGH